MVDLYWPLAVGLFFIAGLSGWVFIHSNRSYLLRWALIPLSLVVATASARLYDARLGYAVPAQLPEKFVYLGHQVIVADDRKSAIEVWTHTVGNRVYRIPYSKPLEESMDRARAQAASGQPVLMRRHAGVAQPKGSGVRDGGDGERYESKVLLPSDIAPKVPAQPSAGGSARAG
jgi:hypothetical protein